MIDKKIIYQEIREAGFRYAQNIYTSLSEDCDEDGNKDSFDDNHKPLKDYCQECAEESAYHNWYSCTDDEFFREFDVQNLTQEQVNAVKGEELIEQIVEGINNFIDEKYPDA